MSVTSAPVSTVSVFGNRSLCFYKMTHDLRDLSNDVGVCAMVHVHYDKSFPHSLLWPAQQALGKKREKMENQPDKTFPFPFQVERLAYRFTSAG